MSEKHRRIVKLERSHRAVGVDEHATLQTAASLTVEQAMQEFLQAKTAERSAPRTLRDYRRHFHYLLNWLEEHYTGKKLNEITSSILLKYVAWMTNDKEQYGDHPLRPKLGLHGLSPVTVNVRVRTLRAFFNWCTKQGYFKKSPAYDIKLQKTDTESITAFDQTHIRKLLGAPDTQSFVGFRDYVIMLVLLDTGLRIGELFSLTKEDVDIDSLTLTVPWQKAKTRKKRVVPLSKGTVKMLLELMRENDDFGPKVDKLFYSAYGAEMSASSFDRRLKIYAEQCGIDDVRVSAHTFRHTFALHWIKSGGDPFSLQKILGHTDMSMVKRYVRLSDTDVSEKHRKHSAVNWVFQRH